jgi:hypothetical protein
MITRQAFCSELTIQPSGCRARLRIDGGEEFELALRDDQARRVQARRVLHRHLQAVQLR